MKEYRLIKKLINDCRIQTGPVLDQRIMAGAFDRFKQKQNRSSAPAGPSLWRLIMNRPKTKLSLAALVVLVGIVVMHFGETSNVAWAQVLENVNSIDTYVFRIRQVETTGARPDGFEFATEKETTVYRSESLGAMDETLWNGELFQREYRSLLQGKGARICYPLENYESWPLSPGVIQSLQAKHPKQIIVTILEGQYTSIGRDRISDREVEGIETKDPNALIDPTGYYDMDLTVDDFVARIWIDMKTQLPVWLEFRFTPQGSSLCRTLVMDQFQWGADLDPDVFAFSIPTGFKFLDYNQREVRSKTDTQVAFDENKQSKPYLGDYDALAIPDVNGLVLLSVDTHAAKEPMRLVTVEEIWQAQDTCMATWPAFDQVKGPLTQELEEAFDLDSMDVKTLVTTGMALRERFWTLGGCLSEVSYPYAFAARIMIDRAHHQAPEDMDITDQLTESIMTYEVLWPSPPDPNRFAENPAYTDTIMALRSQQFERIKQAVVQGQIPTWKDLVRISELAVLLGYTAQFDEGLDVVVWLETHKEQTGWTAYSRRFETLTRCFNEQRKYGCRLFNEPDATFPEEYRYSRRLCSFQGPNVRRHELSPRF